MNQPILSFCIPVMDRLADLQQTLAQNLDDNRSSTDRVEFIVACFDEEDDTERWVHEQFPQDLESGFLRFERLPVLPHWHFGRAKNAFKPLMQGRIYASLDGDNFTGPGAAEHIISVFEALDFHCVFHQFQGTWGDGTSGRIALTREDYQRYGYDEAFLPRQWDEMDAMLSVLAHRPDHAYACYRGKGVIRKSPHFRSFFKDHARTPRVHEIDADSDPARAHAGSASTDQRDKRYVKKDPLLVEFSNYNQYQSFFKNSDQEDLKTRYVVQLVSIQQKLVRAAASEQLLDWVLAEQNKPPVQPLNNGMTVLACLKDEPDPQSWYRHYKALGARRFLLVDDDSVTPLADVLRHEDVHIWSPRVGHFRFAKTLWLETLLANYCQDLWCLTVDGDEFLTLPAFEPAPDTSDKPLDILLKLAMEKQQDYFCGFLVDLYPKTGADPGDRGHYDCYQYGRQSPPPEYRKSSSVSWSYGAFSAWAYSLDLRYRINHAIDSMRKFPCFRYSSNVHLNQGFHDLLIGGKPRSAGELKRPDLLPIAHYKLWSMREQSRHREQAPNPEQALDFSAYHERTRKNLERLAADLDGHIRQATALDDGFDFLGYGLIPVPGSGTITLEASPPARGNLERLERRSSFHFSIGEQVVVQGNSLSGPDFETAVDWLRNKTPYREIVDSQAGAVTLGAVPDPAVESSGKRWFGRNWFKD